MKNSTLIILLLLLLCGAMYFLGKKMEVQKLKLL